MQGLHVLLASGVLKATRGNLCTCFAKGCVCHEQHQNISLAH